MDAMGDRLWRRSVRIKHNLEDSAQFSLCCAKEVLLSCRYFLSGRAVAEGATAQLRISPYRDQTPCTSTYKSYQICEVLANSSPSSQSCCNTHLPSKIMGLPGFR